MLHKLMADNYKEIETVARNITRVKNERHAKDLINSSYIIAASKEPPSDNLEFIKWYSKIMKFVFIGRRSSFNKLLTPKEMELHDGVQVEDRSQIDDIYINAENTNEETKEFIEISSALRKESLDKYLEVLEFRDSLHLWEREIFELYFERGMSTREMAKSLQSATGYEMNYQRINVIVNEVKLKINKHKWKSLNL